MTDYKSADVLLNTPIPTGYTPEFELRMAQRFINQKDFFRILAYFQSQLNNVYIYSPDFRIVENYNGNINLNHLDPQKITEESYSAGYKKNFRKSWITDANNIIFWSYKESIDSIDYPNIFTRFSKAIERNISSDPLNDYQRAKGPSNIRVKERWSFVISESAINHPFKNFRIDLTKVNDGTRSDPRQTSFEIELEYISNLNTDFKTTFLPAIRFMLGIIQNTECPITQPTLENVVVGYNKLFEKDIEKLKKQFNPSQQLFNVIIKPVNVLYSHLLFPETLSITDKADGERKLLFIREDGGYLINAVESGSGKSIISNVSKWFRTTAKKEQDYDCLYFNPETTKQLANTLFDGELIIDSNNVKRYLIFDILFDSGGDVRNLPFVERIEKIKSIVKSSGVADNRGAKHPFEFKDFFIPDKNVNFFKLTNKVLDSIPDKNYKNDGLIFNDIRDPYNSTARIYKWKPVELLTIDFKLLKNKNGEFNLMVKGRDALVPFNDFNKKPMIFKTDDLIYKENQIVEFGFKQGLPIPYRIRFDRTEPNRFETAVSIYKDVLNPITETTIRGKDLVMMRKIHNQDKKNLLEKYCKSKRLLDIGSGKGGDIQKWKEFDITTYTVEPNPEYITEFVNRLKSEDSNEKNPDKKMMSKVKMLMAGGQETDKIVKFIKEPVDCITIFNALTFFFQSEELLNSLIETVNKSLKNGGYLIGMVMDSEMVKELFYPGHSIKYIVKNKLKEGEFYNIDSNVVINTTEDLFVSEKYRIASKSEETLKDTIKLLKQSPQKTVKDDGFEITNVSAEEFGEEVLRTSQVAGQPSKSALPIYNQEILIDLEANIVTEQTEWLVNFNELHKKLKNAGFTLVEKRFLYYPQRLSESQNKLSKCYREFVYQKNEVILVPPSVLPEPVPLLSSVPLVPSVPLISTNDENLIFVEVPEVVTSPESRSDSPEITIEGVVYSIVKTKKECSLLESIIKSGALDDKFTDTELLKKAILKHLKREWNINTHLTNIVKRYPTYSETKEILKNCKNWKPLK